jgi:hypothetical protein
MLGLTKAQPPASNGCSQLWLNTTRSWDAMLFPGYDAIRAQKIQATKKHKSRGRRPMRPARNALTRPEAVRRRPGGRAETDWRTAEKPNLERLGALHVLITGAFLYPRVVSPS